MDYRFLEVHPGRIARVAINRPERRNAIGRDLERELLAAFHAAEEDPACHVVILHANGPGFCAGHDIKDQAERAAAGYRDHESDIGRRPFQEEVWNIRKPIVSAVHGFCGPHGTHTIIATDYILAADDARFSFEQLRVSGAHSNPLLTFTIGLRRYKEWRLMAKAIDAETAERWGLVNRVVPRERLMDEAQEAAEVIAATPLVNSIANKLSMNKDFDRLGIWELARLRPLWEGSTNNTPGQAEYFRQIREEGVGAAVRSRDAGQLAE